MKLLTVLLLAAITAVTACAQTAGQNVIQKKNVGAGFALESFTLGNSQLIGRTSSGVLNGITLGSGLSLSGTTLTASGTADWGSITGALSSQTDLQTALDAKLATSTAASTYQPLDAGLTALAGLADASGVLTNNGSGSLSYTATSTGGNFTSDSGKLAKYSSAGELYASMVFQVSGPGGSGTFPVTAISDSGITISHGTGNFTSLSAATMTGGKYLRLPAIGTEASPATLISNLDTGTVTSTMLAGSIAISKLAITGTPDGTKYLRDDGTWQTVSSGATLGANTFTGLQQFSGTDHAGLRLNNLTTTQRDALAAPSTGMVIWNTTAARIQAYNGSAWTAGMVRLDGDTMTGALVNSANSAASTPALSLTGSIFTGGTGTTNTPHLLIVPSSGVTANTGWSAQGTALGIVLPDSNTGNFLQLRRSNTDLGTITYQGRLRGFDLLSSGGSGVQLYTTQATSSTENTASRSILLGPVASGLRMAAAYTVAWSSNTAGSADAFSNNDTILSRIGVGILGIEGSSTGGAIQLREMTAPSAPAADRARMWIEDNGSGKTRLMIQFGSGTAQQIAIEP